MNTYTGRHLRAERQAGTLLVVGVMLLSLLAALSTAFFTVVQKNSRQSRYMNRIGELRHYAETGVNLSVYELSNGVQGGDGKIGTELWTPASDLGKDGRPATGDEGEGDGMPTPGEPNLTPASVGPADQGIKLLVWSTETAWPNVKRIVATAYTSDASTRTEVHASTDSGGAALGAAYVEGGVKWNLSGPFLISGFDTNPDGKPGPKPPIPAIATSLGYAELFKTQLTKFGTHIIGLGTKPSVAEFPKPDFDGLFNSYKAKATRRLTKGSYASVKWGDWAKNDYQVTYVSGDLSISSGTGAGVLLVDGNFTINGPTRWVGLVMSRNSVVLTGGGSVKIYGALQTKQPIKFAQSGDAAIVYSSFALSKIGGSGSTSYRILHWNYLN